MPQPDGKPTASEAKADLGATRRDISHLKEIEHHIKQFIEDSHGEDRSKLKVTLLFWATLLDRSRKLETEILNFLA